MGKFLLHLNFLILVAFNFFNFIANKIGFSFSLILEFIICLFSFFYIVQHGGLSRIDTRKYKLPLLFLGIIFISFLFHYNEDSVFKFKVLLVRTVFIIFVIDLFISSGFRLNENIIFVAGVVISLILIYNASLSGFQLRTSLVIEETTKSRIIIGVIEDSRTLAFIIAYFLFNSLSIKRLSFIGIVLISIGLLLTQTRQTILAVVLIILPYYLLNNVRSGSFIKQGVLLILSFSSIISFFYFTNIDFNEMRIMADGSESSFERVNLFRWAFGLFEDKPIFGFGFGYTDQAYSYPHNIILEIMAELGIVGLVFFLLALFNRFCAINDGKIRALIIFTFLLALISGNITQNYLFFFTLFIDQRYFKSSSLIRH